MYISPKAKTVIVSAVVIALIYAAVEFGVKPKVSDAFGVRVK